MNLFSGKIGTLSLSFLRYIVTTFKNVSSCYDVIWSRGNLVTWSRTNKLNHIDLEEKLEFNDRTRKKLATDYATLCRHAKPRSLSVGNVYLSNNCVKMNYLSVIPDSEGEGEGIARFRAQLKISFPTKRTPNQY